MRGTECVAPKDLSQMKDKNKGLCRNKCETTVCPQYQHCSINEDNGDADCSCLPFDCNEDVAIAVSATRVKTGEDRLFNNMCEMVNENCKLEITDPDRGSWQ